MPERAVAEDEFRVYLLDQGIDSGGELPGGSGTSVRAECYGAALLDSLEAVSVGFRPRPEEGQAREAPIRSCSP